MRLTITFDSGPVPQGVEPGIPRVLSFDRVVKFWSDKEQRVYRVVFDDGEKGSWPFCVVDKFVVGVEK